MQEMKKMNKNYIVYAHINKENGKAYIGITCRPTSICWGKDGKGYKEQSKFYNAILKYGWENFIHIELANNLSQDEALELETYYIQHYNSIENGYNVLLQGIKTYPKTKKVYCLTTNTLYNSIKEAAEKNDLTTPYRIIENCKGLNSGVKGLEWTYWDDINNCPKNKPIFVQKEKSNSIPIYCIELQKTYSSIGEASRELNIDKSSLQKVLRGERNGAKGYHFVRDSEKEKISQIKYSKIGNKQKVICLETKTIFNSLKEAGDFCGRTSQTVMKTCQGKQKTCGGYHFAYYKGGIEEDV